MAVRVYALDPLQDPRWPELVERHPDASMFHSRAWLEALRRTYAYEPVAYTTSLPGTRLANGIVFCRINSWLTGRRLVSLPFSDHSEPLTDSENDLQVLLSSLARNLGEERWKYIELRPVRLRAGNSGGFAKSAKFYLHRLDLAPSLEMLFRSFHKNCIQRKIRRAEREALTYDEGRSEELLQKFYRLLVLTCRRRNLPPQPHHWFRHLIDCVGEDLKIRMASKDGRPVAGILTLAFKDSMTYKYGCSDAAFNSLGGTPFLLWNAIKEAKAQGIRTFDLGRSDYHTPGLVAFKDRWGATRSALHYLRYPVAPVGTADTEWKLRVAKGCFARMPDHLLVLAGKMVYPHIA
jgi:hypothetical protein